MLRHPFGPADVQRWDHQHSQHGKRIFSFNLRRRSEWVWHRECQIGFVGEYSGRSRRAAAIDRDQGIQREHVTEQGHVSLYCDAVNGYPVAINVIRKNVRAKNERKPLFVPRSKNVVRPQGP